MGVLESGQNGLAHATRVLESGQNGLARQPCVVGLPS
jgi:hypothetical protein